MQAEYALVGQSSESGKYNIGLAQSSLLAPRHIRTSYLQILLPLHVPDIAYAAPPCPDIAMTKSFPTIASAGPCVRVSQPVQFVVFVSMSTKVGRCYQVSTQAWRRRALVV